MTVDPFNSQGGFSVGIPPILVVDNNGNIVSNFLNLSGNVSANKIYSDNYYYANGQPFIGGGGNANPGGNNTQLQFNNAGNFGGIPNVTWNGSVLSLGSVSALSISGGTANYFLQTDGNGILSWAEGGTGNGHPAGSNTQVQFNDDGVFGASSNFTFNSSTNILSVTNINASANIVANKITATSNVSANKVYANYFLGDGSNITNVTALTAQTVTDAAQPNITSVGNLTSLTVNGNVSATNFKSDYYRYANGVLIDFAEPGGSNTQVQFNDDGNLNGTTNFTFNKSNNTLSVSGSIISGNANLGNSVVGNYFIGSGLFLSNLQAANLVGSVPLAAQVSGAAQPNITSVGSLTSLIVVGNISSFGTISGGDLTATGTVSGPTVSATTTLSATGTVNFTASPNVSLGPVGNLHISGGSNNYVLTTNGNGVLSWSPGGSGSPGGSNTQIQYNDGGAFNGSAALTFNEVSNTFTIAGDLVANSVTIGAGAYKYCTSNVYFATTLTTAKTTLISIDADDVAGIDFTIIATNTANNSRQISKISTVVYQGDLQYNEYSTLFVNNMVGDLSIGYDPGNIFNPASVVLYTESSHSSLTVYKVQITVYQD